MGLNYASFSLSYQGTESYTCLDLLMGLIYAGGNLRKCRMILHCHYSGRILCKKNLGETL